MVVVLAITAVWTLVASLVVGLCAAARLGDRNAAPIAGAETSPGLLPAANTPLSQDRHDVHAARQDHRRGLSPQGRGWPPAGGHERAGAKHRVHRADRPSDSARGSARVALALRELRGGART